MMMAAATCVTWKLATVAIASFNRVWAKSVSRTWKIWAFVAAAAATTIRHRREATITVAMVAGVASKNVMTETRITTTRVTTSVTSRRGSAVMESCSETITKNVSHLCKPRSPVARIVAIGLIFLLRRPHLCHLHVHLQCGHQRRVSLALPTHRKRTLCTTRAAPSHSYSRCALQTTIAPTQVVAFSTAV